MPTNSSFSFVKLTEFSGLRKIITKTADFASICTIFPLFSLQAIDEPNFCEAYANMCRVMSQHRAPAGEGANQNQGPTASQTVVVFRKVLLTRCQKEFEKDRTSENVLSKMRKKLDDAKTEVGLRFRF